jgi:hypothetical protein
MDKNTSIDWIKTKFKSKLDKGKNEAVRLSKIGKIRIEISSLNKKKEEFMTLLGKKVYQLIEEGKISNEYFEPDYSEAVKIEKNIQDLIDKIAEINAYYDNLKYEDDEINKDMNTSSEDIDKNTDDEKEESSVSNSDNNKANESNEDNRHENDVQEVNTENISTNSSEGDKAIEMPPVENEQSNVVNDVNEEDENKKE